LPALSGLLVTGGYTTSEAVVPNDVRSTSAGWVAASPGSRRVEHTLTAIGGDRALVIGGRASDTEELGSVRLFAGSGAQPWTPLTPILPRFAHTATLIPGRDPSAGVVLITGGYSDPVNLSATTVSYDFSGVGTPTDVRAMVPNRAYHAAALLHGKVVVTGGLFNNEALARVDVYDPEINAWYELDSLNAGRFDHTLTLLDSDSLLVTGGRDLTSALASAEVLRPRLPGESCDPTRRECLSGHCVDGVCCQTACDESCQSCDAEGVCQNDITGGPVHGRAACPGGYLCEKGACLQKCTLDDQCDVSGYFCDGKHCVPRLEAGKCTRDPECVDSLQCVDGFCCNSPCEGQCEACDKPEHEGTCTAIGGAPHHDRTSCAGSGGDCGLRCDGTDRLACHFPQKGSSCSQVACSDGVEQHPGKCDGKGSCSDEPVACVAFTCDPETATCGVRCSEDSHCAAGYFCQGESCVEREGLGVPCPQDGACLPGLICEDGVCCGEQCEADSSCDATPGSCKKRVGVACLIDSQCGLGHCVDGVCCESACAGQCEACNVVDHAGECQPIEGPPVGARDACDAGDGRCSAKTCDGRNRESCAAWQNVGETCVEASCLDGRFFPARSCDAAGECRGVESIACRPYACGATGCLERCDTQADCAADMACVANECVPPGPRCISDTVLDDGFGIQTDCMGYRCVAGECLKRCTTSNECSPESVCDGLGSCISAKLGPAAQPHEGCGCAVPGSEPREPRRLALGLLLILFVVHRRRQRKASLAKRSASTTFPSAKPS
jgi:MYXO-CTERM domain-containing protein